MMEPGEVLKNLKYVEEFDSIRQHYYIYKGDEHYVLLTISKTKGREAGNVNFISKDAVEYVIELFEGQQRITANDVFEASTRPALLQTPLEALNALYVICATQRGKRDMHNKGTPLRFNVWSRKA